MKISIGTNIKDGPWGGGNLFAIKLTNFLISQGHKVISNLADSDIYIILLTEPRKTSESSAVTHIDVNDYLHYKNNTNEGYMNIQNLHYTMNQELHTADITYFTTGREPSAKSRVWKDLIKTKHPFSNGRNGSMKMLL